MLKHSFLILCLSFFCACSDIAYYSQAASGQLDIFSRSQSIDKILTDPATPTPLKQQLTNILKMRAFASEVLHLPDNGSYTYYADLERPFVVWSVFATPPFSFTPKQWCFLIVGCISYRGYFSETAAETLAKKLRAQGSDVYIAGIPAYSTLGWFNDPIFNTLLKWHQYQIAGLIFHELAHQKLYIADDTAFNEAFAMTIEYVGVERWLAQHGTPDDRREYQQARQRQREFVKLVLSARRDLEHIYQQNLPKEKKQIAKITAYETLRTQYQQLKTRWGDYTGYDAWFAKDLNNAKLLSIITYQDLVPAFRNLLKHVNDDLQAFYQAVKQLEGLSIEERHAKLQYL